MRVAWAQRSVKSIFANYQKPCSRAIIAVFKIWLSDLARDLSDDVVQTQHARTVDGSGTARPFLVPAEDRSLSYPNYPKYQPFTD